MKPSYRALYGFAIELHAGLEVLGIYVKGHGT